MLFLAYAVGKAAFALRARPGVLGGPIVSAGEYETYFMDVAVAQWSVAATRVDQRGLISGKRRGLWWLGSGAARVGLADPDDVEDLDEFGVFVDVKPEQTVALPERDLAESRVVSGWPHEDEKK